MTPAFILGGCRFLAGGGLFMDALVRYCDRGRIIRRTWPSGSLEVCGFWARRFLKSQFQLGTKACGLDDKRIGASGFAHRPGTGTVVVRYHEDDRRLRKMLDVLRGLGSIQLRQVLVHQNQFRRQSQGVMKGLTAIWVGSDCCLFLLLNQAVVVAVESAIEAEYKCVRCCDKRNLFAVVVKAGFHHIPLLWNRRPED